MRTFLFFLASFTAFSSLAQKVTQVESFSPTGAVGSTEQVHIRFSDFIFPLGETHHEAPVSSLCDQYGTGRWLNPKEWVFDFKQPLPTLTQCDYTFKAGLKSTKGVPVIAGQGPYFFKLEPSALTGTVPRGSKKLLEVNPNYFRGGIDPDQVFILIFNRKISKEDVKKRISFLVQGRNDPVLVDVLDDGIVKKIRKSEYIYVDGHSETTLVAVKPKLDFPNSEYASVALRDGGETVFYFRTRPYFKAEFSCNRDNAQAPCSPIQRTEITFNSFVAVNDLMKIRAVPLLAKGVALEPDSESLKGSSHFDRVSFKGPFKAGETYRFEIPKELKDISGEALSNQKSFPLTVKFDSLPSVAKFPGTFGVIESANPTLPLSIRNIDKSIEIKESSLSDLMAPERAQDIIKWLRRVELQNVRVYHEDSYDIRKHQPEAQAANYESVFSHFPGDLGKKIQHTTLSPESIFDQAEVVGVPIKEKGFHIVELESKVLGEKVMARATPLYVSTAVLVTNLAVHFKWGKNAPSLAWVTELSSGKPVSGAEVSVQSCEGKLLDHGVTSDDGTVILNEAGSAKARASLKGCNYQTTGNTKLVVMAKKGDDFSFTLDTFNKGIERWRFNLPYANESNIAAHSVLARDLLKPGQTVFMKHYFREFHWQGFTVPEKKPTHLLIVHNGSEEQWSLPVKFDAQGIAISEWKVPDEAKLGYYSLFLSYGDHKKKNNFSRVDQINVGGFEVQEFRLPIMNVLFKAPDPVTQDTKNQKISVQGTYLSGGPASGLPIELRFLRDKAAGHLRFIGDYVYSLDERVKEGVSERKNYYEEMLDGEDGDAPIKKRETLETSRLMKSASLDSGGSAYVDLPSEVLDTDQDGDVKVSLTYSDPNGEIQTLVRSLSVFSRDRYLGLQRDTRGYFDDPKNIKLDLRLAEVSGRAVPEGQIHVTLFRSTDFTHRAKLVGGFYGYQTTTEIKKLGEFCGGKTDPNGKFTCVGNVPESGSYLAEVDSVDSKGRPIVFVHAFSVEGRSWDLSEYSESDRLTLVPSKSEYGTHEEAAIEVKSSFQDATALVTLERDGVMEHFVTQISGDKPQIKLPIKMEYSPNFVLSVLEVRGRLGAPEPTGVLDLAKPAFKLGMTSIQVGIKAHELPISVHTDQTVYQVRSKVKVNIETKPNAEIALAVVDQALLKLKPNETINLLSSMLLAQGHSVETSTLQMNLIGKRHFGKKATPFGGGGGKMMTRELLDSLVAWKPKLLADKDGKIKTEFKLNDSISSFVVIAVGSEGLNFYGTSKTEIAATQKLQILSSVPVSLRENDELPLQFLLRNTTLNPLHVKAELKVANVSEKSIEVTVQAQSTQELSWNEKVPSGLKALPLLISAVAKEGPSDQLKIEPSIVEVNPIRIREGFLTQILSGGAPSVLPMSFPADAIPGRGGYLVQAQARLSLVPDSVLDYLEHYPFTCLEQLTSKAIGRNKPEDWIQVQNKFKTFLDSNSILKFFPEMRYGSVDLSAYVFRISSAASKYDARFKIQDSDLRKRLLDGLRRGMKGEILISAPWWPDFVKNNQRIAAGEALSSFEAIPEATYEELKSIRDRKSLSHTLSLLKILDQSESSLKQALGDRNEYLKEILSHYTFENSHLKLNDASFSFFGSLNDSPDGLKARTLIALMDHDQKDDATKLLRSLMEAMKTGAFDTTPGDAWAAVALRLFAQKYENSKVNGELEVKSGGSSRNLKLTEKNLTAQTFLPVSEALTQSFKGTGSPWSFTFVEAAIPTLSPINHGYSIAKNIFPIKVAKPNENTRGDIYEVRLEMDAKNDQTWIALTDPIPTGASILSTDSKGGTIAFEERRMDRMQVFFEFLPKGKAVFSYQVRLNQQGSFEFPATRIEAMYDPTEYGEFPNPKIKVNP